jgi:hypothetical protein
VLSGWEEASGGPANDRAGWDVVAAPSSPPDLVEWLPVFHEQGRADLDRAVTTARRDAFLAAAMQELG